jgi:hypothetical protein
MAFMGKVGSSGKRGKAAKDRPSRIKLSDEQQHLIISAVEAGAMDYVAAQAAGVRSRTFRELRQRAEDRHPTRRQLPQLAEFFTRVDEASARARLKREIEIADSDPKHWLRFQGRSQPGLDGWSEPVPEEPETQDPVNVLTVDELQQIVSTLVHSGAVTLSPCPDPTCRCSYHQVTKTEGERDEER